MSALKLPTTTEVDPTPLSRAVALAASPLVAAAFAAGIVYLWLETGFRLAFTYSPNFDAFWVLWNGRVGDIAAMWLTISGVSLVVFFVLGFWVFRGRSRVGTIPWWTVALIISAIAAPLIGEIGTPIGV
jgi:hypothetical protein